MPEEQNGDEVVLEKPNGNEVVPIEEQTRTAEKDGDETIPAYEPNISETERSESPLSEPESIDSDDDS